MIHHKTDVDKLPTTPPTITESLASPKSQLLIFNINPITHKTKSSSHRLSH